MLQADFTAERTRIELEKILSEPGRGAVLQGYDELRNTLGNWPASETVAAEIVRTLQG